MLKKKRETEIILSMDISHIFFSKNLRKGQGAPAVHLRRIELTWLIRKTEPENHT